MNGLPVVTAEEMKRLEKKAFEEGESEQEYMENAGAGIAHVLEECLITPSTHEIVYLLIGKGNNGGDAFVVGKHLLKRGFSVEAFHLFPLDECSHLSKKMGQLFKKAGGKMTLIQSVPPFEKGIILDGLVGTGFQGAAQGFLAELIEAVNGSGLPVFAIDIPSGLNGNTGEVQSVAIKAEKTIFLGLPKIGFFLEKGWNHVGKLIHVDFGLPKRLLEEARATAYLLSEEKAAKALPKIERGRHKYQAGYVLAVAGSVGMPGAAIMACFAALKVGAGIVRLFYPHEMKEELSNAHYELIKEGWDLKDDTRIFEEAKRAKALIVGPGVGRSDEMEEAIKTVLAKAMLPTVIDADGLYFLAKNKEMTLPENVILTPHHQEMQRLLDAPPTFELCQRFVKDKEVTLVLKGAPTVIFHPYAEPLIVPHGDPGMATAGTGDVLTGVIAGLVAQGLQMRAAAVLGVYLHALAGEIAADDETSYSVVASDLIHFLSAAIERVLKYHGSC